MSLLAFIVFTALSMMARLWDKSGDSSHYFNGLLGRCIMRVLRIRLQVSGKEFLQDDGCAVVIAANHQSYMDIMVMLAALPLRFKFLSKQSVFDLPFIGGAMRAAGYISIDRDKTSGNRSSLIQSLEALKQGESLMIFPEGTIPRDGQLGKFQPGAFSLAKKAGVPVLPVTILGTNEILPVDAMELSSGEVRVVICPRIEPEEYGRAELLKTTRRAINKVLER